MQIISKLGKPYAHVHLIDGCTRKRSQYDMYHDEAVTISLEQMTNMLRDVERETAKGDRVSGADSDARCSHEDERFEEERFGDVIFRDDMFGDDIFGDNIFEEEIFEGDPDDGIWDDRRMVSVGERFATAEEAKAGGPSYTLKVCGDCTVVWSANLLSSPGEDKLQLKWFGILEGKPVAMYTVEGSYTRMRILTAQQYREWSDEEQSLRRWDQGLHKQIFMVWRIWKPLGTYELLTQQAVQEQSTATASDAAEEQPRATTTIGPIGSRGLESENLVDVDSEAESWEDMSNHDDEKRKDVSVIRKQNTFQDLSFDRPGNLTDRDDRDPTVENETPDLQIRAIDALAGMSIGWHSDEEKTAALHEMVMTRLGEIAGLLKELGLDTGNAAAYTPPDNHAPVLDSILGFLMAARRRMLEAANKPGTTEAIATDCKTNLIPGLGEASKGHLSSRRDQKADIVASLQQSDDDPGVPSFLAGMFPRIDLSLEKNRMFRRPSPQLGTPIEAKWPVMDGGQSPERKNEIKETSFERKSSARSPRHDGKKENTNAHACNKPLCKPSDYQKKTVSDLQGILKHRLLPQSGKKVELIARIEQSDKDIAAMSKPNVVDTPVDDQEGCSYEVATSSDSSTVLEECPLPELILTLDASADLGV
ncbi:MAG: hypothetical protein Q9208_006587 [Pyrenodesmia sp. 3 TL-2023]